MSLDDLYDFFTDYTGLDIGVRSRAGNLPMYRKYFSKLATMYVQHESTTTIGNRLNRDHSTVVMAISELDKILEVDNSIRKQFETIEHELIQRFPEKLVQYQRYTPDRDYKFFNLFMENKDLKHNLKRVKDELRRVRKRRDGYRQKLKNITQIQVL